MRHLSKNVVDHLLVGRPQGGVVLDGGLAELHPGGVDGHVLVLRGAAQQHVVEQVEVGVLGQLVHEGLTDVRAVLERQLLQGA